MLNIFKNAPLAAIFAQGVDNDGGRGKSERPRQTVEALAWLLTTGPPKLAGVVGQNLKLMRTTTDSKEGIEDGLEGILLEYRKNDALKLVDRLINSTEFSGKTVIISWSHQQLPALAVALGVPRSQVPHKWAKRFDVTWVVEPVAMDKAGRIRMRLTQLPQRLLYGDLDSVFEVGDGFQADERAVLASDNDDDD
ncbi:hypothetical protein HDU96_009326 [Phlyctochytrium bullatum]|nr:hypothetical protein HDU96_009326 [Phlyctochytrium bullatum]